MLLSLPLLFINFYLLSSIKFFYVLWKNVLSYLEEDLAVYLMLRLIFVPLFHDSSIVGRFLSFFFRLFRVLIGIFAFSAATVFILTAAFIWLLAPLLLFTPNYFLLASSIITASLILFLYNLAAHPRKKLREISSVANLQNSSTLNLNKLTLDCLRQDLEVKFTSSILETTPALLAGGTFTICEPALSKAFELAKATNANYLTPAYLWVSCILVSNPENELLKLNLTPKDFLSALKFLEQRRKIQTPNYIWSEDFLTSHLKGVNRGWLGIPTPILDSVSTDLTKVENYADLPEFIGRKEVLKEVINVLSSSTRRNALIIGPSGSGKTLLVKYLAKTIDLGNAPPSISTKRLVELDLPKLLAGTISQGDISARLDAIFQEASSSENIVLFLDEIQNIFSAQASLTYNLPSLIMPYLESNDLQFIAAVDNANFAKLIEPNPSFTRIFQFIHLPPATIEETFDFLVALSAKLSAEDIVEISIPSLSAICQLSQKYIHTTVMPDSARTLFHQAADLARSSKTQVNSSDIKELLSKQTNVPLAEVSEDAADELLNLEDTIHTRFIDQAEAVKSVVSTLQRSSVNLKDEHRPIGSFLFVGPTGVGKTELAKVLSQTYFKSKAQMFRFDMSEYQTNSSIDRLIGTLQVPGLLTEAVEHSPYCLLLFDEFEKSSTGVRNLFLQILEDGRLTDFSGKTSDFTSSIIIATSNAAAITIAQGLQSGKSLEQLKPQVQNELLQIFSPELLNRFDSVVLFKPLSETDLRKIVVHKLADLTNKLKKEGYIIEFDHSLTQALSQQGFDPVMGARPLRRLIQDSLETNLSRLILAKKIQKGTPFTATIDLLNA